MGTPSVRHVPHADLVLGQVPLETGGGDDAGVEKVRKELHVVVLLALGTVHRGERDLRLRTVLHSAGRERCIHWHPPAGLTSLVHTAAAMADSGAIDAQAGTRARWCHAATRRRARTVPERRRGTRSARIQRFAGRVHGHRARHGRQVRRH